jgi:hypothetical protein
VHIDPVTKERAVINRNRRFSYNYFPNEKKTRCFLRDVRSRKQWEVGEATKDLLEIFKDMTDSKVIGFFLTGKSDAEIRINHSQSDYLKREALIDSFKKLKFAELLKFDGYDAYYLIPHGKNLKTVDGEFDKDFDTSVDWDDQKQVKKAIRSVQKDFTNHMKDRLVSRVLLNKFIDHIC